MLGLSTHLAVPAEFHPKNCPLEPPDGTCLYPAEVLCVKVPSVIVSAPPLAIYTIPYWLVEAIGNVLVFTLTSPLAVWEKE